MSQKQSGPRRLALVYQLAACLLAVGVTAQEATLLDQAGRLTTTSRRLDSGEFHEVFTVPVRAGRAYLAVLAARDFQPYLYARSDDGVSVDHDGDGAGVARLAFVAPRDGTVSLVATSVEARETGDFRLIVKEASTLAGALTADDEKLESGESADSLNIWLPADTLLTVICRSTQFDPYLFATVGEDQYDVDDTIGMGNDAMLVLRTGEADTLRLLITSHAAGERGEYTLSLNVGPPPVTGQPLVSSGRLAADDLTLSTGEHYDPVGFFGAAGRTYTVRATSTEFDTYLIVTDAEGNRYEVDDHEGQTDAQLAFVNGRDGLVQVQVTSSRPGETGAYRISVTPGGEAARRSLFAQTNRLDESDGKLDSGEWFDHYTVPVPAGQRLTIRAVSSEFDTYLIVRLPGDDKQLDNDDEAPGKSDARLTATTTAAGEMEVYVTSRYPGETGEYAVSVVTYADDTGAPAGAEQAATLTAGATVNGTLATGDRALESGNLYDLYELAVPAGATYRVTMRSDQLDSYLLAVLPGNQILENDDAADPALGNDAQLDLTLTDGGVCQVLATASDKTQRGAYRLQVEAVAAAIPLDNDAKSIKADSFVEGTLERGDRTLQTGEFADYHRFDATAGEQYVIEMVSQQVNAYLIIIGPDGQQQDNDDHGGTRNARIDLRPRTTGSHQVIATTSRPGERGTYTLRIRRPTAGGTGDGGSGGQTTAASNPAGQSQEVNGELTRNDERLQSGEYFDKYDLTLKGGETLTAQVKSTQFDSFVIIVKPNGETVQNDDAQPGSLDAAAQVTNATAGDYSIIVTSSQAGEVGRYTLVVTRAAAGGPAVGPGPGPGRRPAGGRQTYGVFVGINQYPRAPLRYCAEDAVNAAKMFEELNIIPPGNRQVLTDRQATVRAITNAVLEVGGKAGPDDMLVFFFSGHGGQTRDLPNSNEADRREEYLVAIDGEIMDDDFAVLLDRLRAGLMMVYIDACFSGGFAKDIITKPGRMGVFSSDEDLTSNVAAKFRAGGYLSYFMNKGIRGAADANRDKSITAAELSYYLEDSFARECRDVESISLEDQRGYQRVRIDRGGVKLETPLFRLP